jgi:hypothetical protein
MLRTIRITFQTLAIIGLFAFAAPAFAGGAAGTIQLAFHDNAQTAMLPAGTISLRVIDRVGGPALKVPIKWRIMTYGRDGDGQRHLVTEVTGSTARLVLPAAWYIVYAEIPGQQDIRHPIEVTAGKSFKYTLVKK